MRCPICGEDRSRTRFSNLEGKGYGHRRFALKECERCHSGFLEPLVSFESIEAACYTDSYHAYQPYGQTRNLWRRAKTLIKKSTLAHFLGYGPKKFWQFVLYPFFLRMSFYPHFVSDGKALDVGCGVGKYLHYLGELGWKVYGVDISERAIGIAKASGLKNVSRGDSEHLPFPDDFFEVVNLHHVLEHVISPPRTLKEVYRVLKPGGEVIITLPNFSSWARRVFRRYWSGLDVPRHLFHFHESSLNFILRNNGFGVSEIWFSDTFRGLAASLAHLLFADGQKNEKYFLPFGIGLDLFFDPVLQRVGAGDQLTVKAKKI